MPEDWSTIASRIEGWRKERGLSRKAFALAVYASEGAVFNWERRGLTPGRATRRRVEAYLSGGEVPQVPPRSPSGPPLDAAALRAWRQQVGWTRREVALALEVSESTVALWEHGETRPTGARLASLSVLVESAEPKPDRLERGRRGLTAGRRPRKRKPRLPARRPLAPGKSECTARGVIEATRMIVIAYMQVRPISPEQLPDLVREVRWVLADPLLSVTSSHCGLIRPSMQPTSQS
ncbi:MAG: helix-turn-helix transcriptional regulator [Planctomycetota bacterium]|nr:helix-turn-helix transcriptional regulator [Planctomycetota bacterium]